MNMLLNLMGSFNGCLMTFNGDACRSDYRPSSRAEVTCNQLIGEGFFNNSNSISESPENFLKPVYSAVRHEKATESVGQPVPVIFTNRNTDPTNERQKSYPETPNQSHQRRVFLSNTMTRTETTFKGKLLLIGDYILNGVNTKYLVKGIQNHSKGRATVNDLIKEISGYDVRNLKRVSFKSKEMTVQVGRM